MRADLFLTANGYCPSRQQAKRLIEEGGVSVDGKRIRKASEEIGDGEHVVDVQNTQRYVGRGGQKLEAALTSFGLDVQGMTALDIGASTGGFTDCLLQRGASYVIAVDSGEGQLAPSLRSDARVRSMERCNARYLEPSDLGKTVDLIVMDVSFISATYLLPRFPLLMKENGKAVCLIKPQFEVGRAWIGKGGIVKDKKAHRFAVERVLSAGKEVGLTPIGLIASPIEGGDGNREFLVLFTKETGEFPSIGEENIRRVVG